MQPSQKQRLRLRRILLASSASWLYLLLCWLAFLAGYMQLHLQGMLVLSFVVLASCVIFFLLVRFDLNLRFREPSLTLPQMCWSILVVFVSAYFAGNLRSLFLMMALIVLMFGAFRLDLKGFVRVGVFCAICYALLLIALQRREGIELRQELIQALEFFVLLLGVSMLGLEMSGLRQTLQLRNRELQRAFGQIQQQAITDELTGLYNRRFAKTMLSQQKALADRGGYDFVLCLIDLDFFKAVNDRYGHSGGDAVLRQLAGLLQRSVRNADFVARLGGEEFLLALTRTDPEGAQRVLQRLRETMADVQWDECPGLRLTLSVGVSAYRSPEPWEDVLQRCDEALYRAKDDGRDQVVLL
ncbi:diguanylate cyclase [Pseudomonas indica]|uniref:diguanylate cyclase n=1 Tax=Pseudomonas indica TaxID=137658 RepID=UPI003FD28126